MARVDYDQMAPVYERGRAMPLEALEEWRAALAAYLPPAGGLPVLDLGAGTGLFATALAAWFEVRVVGVEPSAGMRRHARQARSHPGVAYVGGEAQRLPLREHCCGGAWLSAVIHHIDGLAGCALELRRVLVPDGPVLIRNAFPGRHERITLFRFFPGARRIAEAFPTVQATVAAFASVGFAFQALRPVAQVSAPSLRVAVDRVRLRADSTLKLLSDEEFAEGLAAMERAAAAEATPSPVVDHLDLLVLR
ncbi:MAG TPA: class I SAM-dependent methyltransferase [Actinomycetes bacterium]|jgi:ubiquinone/menaquinone biosynthesis C-methylase UbiE|nr:class I SAM-dependent methyltransferase [Actinomycetes bacterium]